MIRVAKIFFCIIIFSAIPTFLGAQDISKKERKELKQERKREKRCARLEQNIAKTKFDNRSRKQKMRDRNILGIMAVASLLLITQIQNSGE